MTDLAPVAPEPHVHVWKEVDVYCEDCGEHPGLRCSAEDDCPDGFDEDWIDLISSEDPREEESP